MRIVFVTDYFYPYIHGGAEVSIYQLAKNLTHFRHQVSVITPNYGTEALELKDRIRIIRIPWFIRSKEHNFQQPPSFFANPISWSYIAIRLIIECQKVDIIHSQSVNSFPGVWLAAKILGKKCVVSIRDNQVLCNYGWCLSKNNNKTCSLEEYFFDDFKHYYEDKVKEKNTRTLLLNILFAIIGRLRVNILKFFINKADKRICGSSAQQKTLAYNGIMAEPIYNIFDFPKKLNKSIPQNEILYATKLSEGKGLSLLLSSWVSVSKKFPNIKLKIVGNGDVEFYKKIVQGLRITKSVKFIPMPSFTKIREIRRKVLIEVVPSIYPESFGRAALEAIALGTPVVATNRGGLIEIVENNVTGYITNPAEKELAEAIGKAIVNNSALRKNIKSEYQMLKQKFETNPVNRLITLYEKLI